jgi:hypothetical protein
MRLLGEVIPSPFLIERRDREQARSYNKRPSLIENIPEGHIESASPVIYPLSHWIQPVYCLC